jgi:mxaJ protein
MKHLSLVLTAALSTLCAAPIATAAEPLQVCASKDELPYSNASMSGFENQLALTVGKLLDRSVEFVFSDKVGIYHVHEMLNPGKCEIILGVDPSDTRVLTSKPYYRSGYVFVYRDGQGIDIKDWNAPAWQALGRIAFAGGTPAENMLRKLGLYDKNLSYMYSLIGFKPRRNQYVRFEPSRMVSAVASGEADLAIIWGPEAARYVKESKVPLVMVPVPNDEYNGNPVIFQYDQAMAVRSDNADLKAALDEIVDQSGEALRQILIAEGIPLTSPGAALAVGEVSSLTPDQ